MNILFFFDNHYNEVVKMYLIPCSDNCIYQKDGRCTLETPSSVTNISEGKCVHFIDASEQYKNNIKINYNNKNYDF